MSPNVVGPYATLPTRTKSMTPKSQSLDIAIPIHEASLTQSLSQRPKPPPALALRRWNSVEVLFPEEQEDEEDGNEDLSSLQHPPFLSSIYTRSVSVSSLDLASPFSNPRQATLSYKRMDSRSSVIGSRFGLSPLPEEEYKVVSRRSSVCSTIIMAGYNTTTGLEYNTTDGFEVIGRQTEAATNSDSVSPRSLPISPRRTDSSSTSMSEGDNEERRRRRSSADIVAPLVAITAHALALSCYLFNQ